MSITTKRPKFWVRTLFWVAKRFGATAIVSIDQPDYHYMIQIFKVRVES